MYKLVESKFKAISLMILLIFCLNLITMTTFATSKNQTVTTDNLETIVEANLSDFNKLSANADKYISKKDGKFVVNETQMKKDGYTTTEIKLVTSLYAQAQSGIKKQSVATTTVKLAAKWLKSNWLKVWNKLPSWAKVYFKTDAVFTAIDLFTGYSDTLDKLYTNIVNYCLPYKYQWATPYIVFVISCAVPF